MFFFIWAEYGDVYKSGIPMRALQVLRFCGHRRPGSNEQYCGVRRRLQEWHPNEGSAGAQVLQTPPSRFKVVVSRRCLQEWHPSEGSAGAQVLWTSPPRFKEIFHVPVQETSCLVKYIEGNPSQVAPGAFMVGEPVRNRVPLWKVFLMISSHSLHKLKSCGRKA